MPGAPFQHSDVPFRALAESVQDAIVVADVGGRVLYANPAAATLFSAAPGDLAGRDLTELMPPAYRDAHRAGLARFAATGESRLVGGDPIALEALRGDGAIVPVELSLGSWVTDGERYVTGVLRDITARVRAERFARAHTIVTDVLSEAETLSDGIARLLAAMGTEMGWTAANLWTLAADGRRLELGGAWQAGAGVLELQEASAELAFEPGEGLPGRAWALGDATWVRDFVAEGFPRSEMAERDGLHAAVAVPIAREGKTLGVLEFFGTEIETPAPDLVDAMRSLSDRVGQFLRRKLADEALEAANLELAVRAAELERSNHDLEQFAYAASHDLAEPLRTIAGFAELLERRAGDRLDDDASVFVEHIRGGAERGRRLIDGLLDYARVGTGALERSDADTAAIVRGVLESMRATVDEAQATVDVGDLPVVAADPSLLARVFQNLISNALKFRGEHPARVSMSATARDGAWEFAIADQGIGIPEPDRERVFGMFGRLRRDETPGTGIGLALCRRIVERHGGEIAISGNEPRGTVVRFTIPAP